MCQHAVPFLRGGGTDVLTPKSSGNGGSGNVSLGVERQVDCGGDANNLPILCLPKAFPRGHSLLLAVAGANEHFG